MPQLTDPIVRVEGLTKRYGKHAVVDGVSFAVEPGTIVALIGGNGAGKTTTLKCLLGITPFQGTVEIGGLRVDRKGRDARRMVGYVPQLPAMSEEDTCEQALAFAAELRGATRQQAAEALEAVQLAPQRSMRVGELSGGMRQRLALAAALLGDPKLLLLDEPTASLDAGSRAEFQHIIRRLRDEGRTVILSTHFYDRLEELADRVLVLRDGALVFDGTAQELVGRAPSRRYVVYLNGDAPAAFLGALADLGIGQDRVQSTPMPWEDIMLAAARREGETP